MPSDSVGSADPKRRTVLRQVRSPLVVSTNPERRGVLKGLLVAATGLFGPAGTGAATGNPTGRADAVEAAREYGSERAVERAITEHGTALLRALANDGYIERAAVSALPLKLHRTPESYVRSEEGVLVFATVTDGGPSVKIQIKVEASDGQRLVLHVDPDVGASSATLVDEATEETKVLEVNSSGGEVGLTPRDCCYRWEYDCGYGCSPYDNCVCVDSRTCAQNEEDPCPCEIIDNDCGPCTTPASCG